MLLPTLAPGRHALAWLAVALIPAFTVTALVARAHHHEQHRLAIDWHARGETALAQHRANDAVDAFRTALTYDRDDRVLRLRLAQSLMAAGRDTEARAHLVTLWDDQPGNGPVNLELGRVAASEGDVPDALRHYHNAIEGAWTDEAESRRRAARLELAQFLVDRRAVPQAQAELIALAADPPSDAQSRGRLADLLLDVDLPRQALPIFEQLLVEHPRERAVIRGAGRAAFALGSDALARRYLARAAAADPADQETATLLEIVRLEETLDPFARRLPSRARIARTLRAIDAAQARVTCLGSDPQAAALASDLAAMRTGVQSTAADRESTDDAMDLVLRVEQATATSCGAPPPIDRALRRIVERRQGAGG
ncbi:MAG TPA: tetratricopeptide repeat protein [Vicinamibacterales bacterium]